MARAMSRKEIKGRLVDAAGGGVCEKHGEYFGTGKHRLRDCPLCDIEEYYKDQNGKLSK